MGNEPTRDSLSPSVLEHTPHWDNRLNQSNSSRAKRVHQDYHDGGAGVHPPQSVLDVVGATGGSQMHGCRQANDTSPRSSILPIAKSTARQAVLPGHGEPGGDCGNIITMHCNSCGWTWDGESSCMLRVCPHCWRKWANKEAHVASERLWAGASLLMHGSPRHAGYRILHTQVSIRDDDKDINEQREEARRIAKRHGIHGALTIYHPFRRDDDDKKYVPDGYVHFHVVGIATGDVLPGGLPADKGAVFKVIRDAKRGDYRGLQKCSEARDLIFYLLTHCGLHEGKHSLTWFGSLSYNMLSNKTLDDAYPGFIARMKEGAKRRCPHCGSEDVEPDFICDRTAWPGDWIYAGHGPPDTQNIYS